MLKTFEYQGKPIRVVEVDGELFWVIKDIALAIGYSTPHKLAGKTPCVERHIKTTGGMHPVKTVNTKELYGILNKGEEKGRQEFKKWLVNNSYDYKIIKESNQVDTEQFKKLFKVDNPGRYLLLDKGPIPMWQEGRPDYDAHLSGKESLCVVPIGFDNTCYFGALDLDAKGEDCPPIPHMEIQSIIDSHNLPLNIFYSSSGKGAHIYIFSKAPIPAKAMRNTLKLYSMLLEESLHEMHDIEIFPKQNTLEQGDDGNCIRIPYFGDKCQPVFTGDPRRAHIPTIPPCLEDLPKKGERNNFIYHIANFFYLCELEKVLSLVKKVNRVLPYPLPELEVERTVTSARRQQKRRTEGSGGFGLGCTTCPTTRKDKCSFAAQLAKSDMEDSMEITILHYLSTDEKVKVSVDGKSIIFNAEDIFNHHKVTTSFILKHGVVSLPEMKQGEWTNLIKNLLKESTHVDAVDHTDRGHYIINRLREWAKSFKSGIQNLHGGIPIFVNESEVIIIPYDLYQHISVTGVYGISQEDIYKTLESIGQPINISSTPAIKIPVEFLQLEGSPVVPPTVVSDIDPDDLEFYPGETCKIYNSLGVEVKLTDEFLQNHPEVRSKIVKNTNSPDIDLMF